MVRDTGFRMLTGIFAVGLTFCVAATPARAAEKVRVLIIDGQNNHTWQNMTPPMKADLERSGRFDVTVATTPPAKSPKEAWDAFHPDFSKYDVVLSNYNGEPWPKRVQKALRSTSPAAAGWRSSTRRTTRSPIGRSTTR